MNNCESERLSFIENRDGKLAAIAFAKQTLETYRTCVLHSRKRGHRRPHHASIPEYREGFIRSYLAFKSYIKANA